MSCPECLDWRHAEGLPGGIVAHLGNSERWRMGSFLKTRLVSSTNALRDGVLRAGAEVWNEWHASPTDYDRPIDLDAAAVARCRKCVLANPGYRPLVRASISGIPHRNRVAKIIPWITVQTSRAVTDRVPPPFKPPTDSFRLPSERRIVRGG